MTSPRPLLSIKNLQAWYGQSHILKGVDLDVSAGKIVTLLGRNGAGKTTTLRSVVGLVRKRSGQILVAGTDALALAPHQIARLGVGYVPEERGIFASLSVDENLRLPPRISEGGISINEIYGMFPNLQERRAGSGARLSGGEQQMLAIARILRTGAKLILLDEPTEGLAPVIVKRIGALLRRLKELGFTVLLVEQNLRFASKLSDEFHVLEQGRVIEVVDLPRLAVRSAALQRLLGV